MFGDRLISNLKNTTYVAISIVVSVVLLENILFFNVLSNPQISNDSLEYFTCLGKMFTRTIDESIVALIVFFAISLLSFNTKLHLKYDNKIKPYFILLVELIISGFFGYFIATFVLDIPMSKVETIILTLTIVFLTIFADHIFKKYLKFKVFPMQFVMILAVFSYYSYYETTGTYIYNIDFYMIDLTTILLFYYISVISFSMLEAKLGGGKHKELKNEDNKNIKQLIIITIICLATIIAVIILLDFAYTDTNTAYDLYKNVVLHARIKFNVILNIESVLNFTKTHVLIRAVLMGLIIVTFFYKILKSVFPKTTSNHA